MQAAVGRPYGGALHVVICVALTLPVAHDYDLTIVLKVLQIVLLHMVHVNIEYLYYSSMLSVL